MATKYIKNKILNNEKLLNKSKAYYFLGICLVLTVFITYLVSNAIEKRELKEFELVCNEIKIKITARLFSHAQLLRSGSSFMTASDTITRQEWKDFYEANKLEKNLPGIQGLGFSLLVPREKIEQHIKRVRVEGFPNYSITPSGERDIYSTIIYLEPFSGRNLRAFGYDMYSDRTRRIAMEAACDNDVAMLTGKVHLVQETNEDVQAGALMYVPVYNTDLPSNTIEERRRALIGWVYCTYRMNDLMRGVLGEWEKYERNNIHIKIYDNYIINEDALLFDSRQNGKFNENRTLTLPLDFNGKRWTLHISKIDYPSFYQAAVVTFVFFSLLSISIFMFLLILSLIKVQHKEKVISELNTSKDKLFSIIAHDLRAPFNGFIGLTKIMSENIDRFSKEEIQEISQSMKNSAINLFELLDNLLVWSKMQRGLISFSLEPQNLNQIAANSLNVQAEQAKQKEIAVCNLIPNNIQVLCDANLISSVFRNLLSNAIKFTHRGGKVELGVKAIEEDMVVCYVKDCGIGMSKDLVSKLFSINEKTSRQGTEEEPSSGLGLLLCKEFVEKHDGRIWVESEVGKGSTFYFTLPIEKNNN